MSGHLIEGMKQVQVFGGYDPKTGAQDVYFSWGLVTYCGQHIDLRPVPISNGYMNYETYLFQPNHAEIDCIGCLNNMAKRHAEWFAKLQSVAAAGSGSLVSGG
jgi:hypothetical protein